MKAQLITDRQQWNDFVSNAKSCTITQSYEWGELGPHLGAQTMHVGVIDDVGQLCAAMLVLVARTPLIHRRYFYALRGPVIDDPFSPALTVLLDFLKGEAHKQGAFMLKVEPSATDESEQWLEALRMHGFHPTPHKFSRLSEWVLDLRPDEQELLAGMKEKWRYNIRLAGRKGVTVRRGGGQDDLDTFYKLYETTSERDVFFIHKKSFYEDILRLYGQDDRCALFLAEYEGQAISASITLRYGRWSWYMYGASANEQRNLMPNHLLQWNAMQWAKSHGCWYYNFRGIPDILEEGQELWGVYLFKRGFGGYVIRALETHDLVYQPLVYQVYRRLIEIKRWREEKRHPRAVSQNGTGEAPQGKVEAAVIAPVQQKE